MPSSSLSTSPPSRKGYSRNIYWLMVVVAVCLWGIGFNETTKVRPVTESTQLKETHHNNGPIVRLVTNDDTINYLSKNDLYTMKRYNTTTASKSSPSVTSKSTTSAASTKNRYCYRYCSDDQLNNNKILYAQVYPIVFQAGLNDRIMILDGLTNLASYLCATIEIPRPRFHLHPMHNNNTPVDISLRWYHFIQFTRVPTNDVNDYDIENHHHQQEQQQQEQLPIVVDMDNPKNFHKLPDPSSMYRSSNYQDESTIRITTETMDQIVTDFKEIELVSVRQQQTTTTTSSANETTTPSFIWEIQENYWFFLPNLVSHIQDQANQRQQSQQKQEQSHGQKQPFSNKTLLPSWLPLIDSRQAMKTGECRYVIQTRTSTMQYVIDRIWNEDIASKQSATTRKRKGRNIVIYLHIRRTDTTNVCNTTLPRMESYLQCSLASLLLLSSRTRTKIAKSARTMKMSITILFGSDETDQQYRNSIQQIIRRIDDTIRFISIDDLVRQRVDDYIQQFQQQTAISSQNNPTVSRSRPVLNKKKKKDSSIRNSSPSSIGLQSLTSAHRNNYYLFEIQNAIMERANFLLEQHRSDSCNDCDPIHILQ